MPRTAPASRALPALLFPLLLLACAEKKPAAAAAPAPAPPAAPDAAPAPTPAAASQPLPPTKDALRAYRKHLTAGRKHAAGKAWGEAVVDFEAALAALPYDGRALSELAWAAFNAGDHAKARKAGIASVLVASDAKVKASALYNLGRVEEATADAARAAKLYRQSLTLRPNKIVAERLAGLDVQVDHRDDETDLPDCGEQGRLADGICPCIVGHAEAWDRDFPADQRRCSLAPEGPVPGLRLAYAKLGLDTETVLLVGRGEVDWSVVATLAETFNPGAFGIYEEWKLVSMSEQALGGRRVAKIVTEHHRQDSDLGVQELETSRTTRLTVCVLGDGKARVTCPLQVPLVEQYTRERIEVGAEDEELDEEMRRLQTPGLPIRQTTELRVDLAPDGTATVVLVKGSADPAVKALLGPRRLW